VHETLVIKSVGKLTRADAEEVERSLRDPLIIMDNLYALIMAGGSGTRLWPRSRRDSPKQFLDITSSRTMLQETYDRIRPLIPPGRIWVITNDSYVGTVREQLPEVSARNVIGEPAGHGTGPAIGLAAVTLNRIAPDAIMIVQTADHLIKDVETFRSVLLAAAQVAAEDHLVTLGIQPSQPETGYGYIHRGEPLGRFNGHAVYRVRRFVEKPDLATALQMLAGGEYYWNSGMFAWRVDVILRELERYMPALYTQLTEIARFIDTPRERAMLERVWAEVANQTIDYGVMERADDVAVVPADIGWSDVGSWATLFELLPLDDNNNVVIGEHVGVETRDTLIYSPHRLIATVGVQDLIIVDTDDALLVCPRHRAQEVKALVDELKRSNRHKYL
jgi:mannose-1-phosphate guanylyltransferase